MNINLIEELIGEEPDDRVSDLMRVKMAIHRSKSFEAAEPREYGSKVVSPDGKNLSVLEAIDGSSAEVHTRDEFTYLVFPIKTGCKASINAVPSYLLPKGAKVEVVLAPNDVPLVVADDKYIGLIIPNGQLCVILGENDKFLTWYPLGESEEPWEMTAMIVDKRHKELAQPGKIFTIGNLESYLGGSFSVVKKSRLFYQMDFSAPNHAG